MSFLWRVCRHRIPVSLGMVLIAPLAVSACLYNEPTEPSELDLLPQMSTEVVILQMQGAGTLGDGSPRGDSIWLQSFDFIVGIGNGVVDGVLDYTDYSVFKDDGKPANLRVGDEYEGTAILEFAQTSVSCVTFSGIGELMNTGELLSFVAEACDNAQPGENLDLFGIRVPDRLITDQVEYVRRDLITDGEITAHFQGEPSVTITRLHGTGAIVAGEDTVPKQLFDFDVGVESGVVGGFLDYTDERITMADGNYVRLYAGLEEEDGTAITSFLQLSNSCIESTGIGKLVNTGELVRFRIQACDNAPGPWYFDVFGIWVPEHEYQRGPEPIWSGDLIADRILE